jgi:hypothetical protein
MKPRNIGCIAFLDITFYGSTRWLAERHSKQKPFTLPTRIDGFAELSGIVNGTSKDFSTFSVGACGTEDGKDVAWITASQTGEVTFFNQNGDKTGCTLNNGLQVGSWCSASNYKPMTTTGLFSAQMISTTVTVSSSSSSTVSPSTTVSDSKSDTATSTSTCGCP